MNSLEGYNTNGHEYRISQLDRSNSRRIKWMLNEARDKVEKEDRKKENDTSIITDKNIKKTLHGNTNTNNRDDIRKNMFDPSTVNKFSNFKNNFK